jgi:hypothetical protein
MRRIALAALIALARPASADPATAELSQAMQRYFDGEKAEGYAWLELGAGALVAAGSLLEQRGDLAKGLAWPLVGFGAVQLAAGLWLLGVTDERVAKLRRALDERPEPVRDGERTRIRSVERGFVVLRWAEIALAAGGAATAVAGLAARVDAAAGAGASVLGESALMLLLDGLAARRAHRYAAALDAFSPSVAIAPGGARLGASWRF